GHCTRGRMLRMRSLFVMVFSWLFPGFGAAFARQTRAMLVWAAVAIACTLAIAVSIWFVPLAIAVRFASAVGGYRRGPASGRVRLRRDGGAALIAVAIHAVAFPMLKMTAVEAFKVPASSMVPTLAVGDHIFVEKLSKHWHAFERGEVVVFRQPCEPDRDYIKR